MAFLTRPKGGMIVAQYGAKTADYTAKISDDILTVDTTAGNKTVTLPAAATCTGKVLTIKKLVTANTLTIDGNASETIDSVTTKVMSLASSSVSIMSDGSNWHVVGTGGPFNIASYLFDTSNGYGSTNTHVRKWTNSQISLDVSSLLTVVYNSATLGAVITANRRCRIFMQYSDQYSGPAIVGISLNATDYVTDFTSLTRSQQVASTFTSADQVPCTAVYNGILDSGSKLAPHNNLNTTGASTSKSWMSIFAEDF